MSTLTELSNILWTQRRTLERLMYRLEVQQLVLAAGRTRWIAAAAGDVEAMLERIRATELSRAVQTTAVAEELGLPTAEPTLRELMAAAPAPWDSIFRDHHEAFLAMTSEIDELSRQNSALLQRGFQATRDYLNTLHGSPEVATYSASGSAQSLGRPSHLVDTAF